MIQSFVDQFMANKTKLMERLAIEHPGGYGDLVRLVIEHIDDEYGDPDPTRIHEIDDGDYHGTLVYVIGAANGYDYWYTKISYGSCSTCDTFQSIREYEDGAPNSEQINDYWTLMLHIVQGLTEMN